MSDTQAEQPSPEELQDALELTARISAHLWLDPQVTAGDRHQALGDYLICCSLAWELPAPAMREKFAQGLIDAGLPLTEVQRLCSQYIARMTWRSVGTLSYIPADQQGRGIKRTRRGVSLEEAEFIRGILERRSVDS